MKNHFFIILSILASVVSSQNIQNLFDNIPMPNSSCEETFKSAEIEWDKITLDNDSIFNRAKSWAPGGDIKTFALKLDKLQAFIDKSSENNSFSLSAPPTIDKTVMKSIEQLSKTREGISNIWNASRETITNINSSYIVPNEIDNGCDQMETSMKSLNNVSGTIIEQLTSFKTKIATNLSEFQNQFDELNQIKNPMVNNQILDEMSNLLSILNQITNGLNFHYKNMVETRMAWNNALCK